MSGARPTNFVETLEYRRCRHGPFGEAARLALARCRLALEDVDGALTQCDTLLKDQGDKATTWRRFWSGRTPTARGLSEKAEADLQRAKKLSPFATATLMGRAGLRTAEGKFEEADRHLGQAIEIDPGNPRLYSARFTLRNRSGRVIEAASDAAMGKKLVPLASDR